MRKKLLIAIALLVSGVGNLWAQTDVFKDITTGKITNPSFEANNGTVSDTPSSGTTSNDITGWTFTQNNGRVAVFNSSSEDDTYGSSSPSAGTYYVRIRTAGGSSSGNQTLTSASSFSMPKGTYRVSFDYKAGRVHNYDKKFTVSAMNGSTTLGTIQTSIPKAAKNNTYFSGNWTTNNFSFSLTENKDVKIKIDCEGSSSSAGRTVLALDNFVLEWNLTQSLKDLITEANDFLTAEGDSEGESYTALKSAIDAADAVTESDNASTLEAQYNALSAVLALAKDHRKPWLAAKTTAQAAIDNTTDYGNVVGEEKTNLQTEIGKAEPSDADGYDSAKTALEGATTAFTGAKTNYDALATVNGLITSAGTLTYADPDKKPSVSEAATSASDADSKTASQYTDLRAYYESHALAERVTTRFDKTSALANPDAMDANNGWTITGTMNPPKNAQPWTDASGISTHWYFDGGDWNNSSWTTTMSQNITLPAGNYLLTAKGRAAVNTTLTMTVGEVNVALPHVGNTGNVFNNGWGDASLEFTLDSRSNVDIVVTATSSTINEWFSVCDFRLIKLDATLADSDDYDALASAISTAEAKTLGFEEGEYAPYENVDALEKLAVANAFDPSVDNLKSEVNDATTKLSGATWTANVAEVDGVYDGTLKNAEIKQGESGDNVVLAGWVTKSGNTRQTFKGTEGASGKACLDGADDQVGLFVHPGTYNYGETVGYTMPLKSGAVYVARAKYCSWSNNDNKEFTLTILKNGSSFISKSFGANSKACTMADALKEVKLFFSPDADANYVLSITVSGNTFMTDFYVEKATATTINENSDYTPTAGKTFVELTRNFNADAWNTLVLPFNMTLAEAKAVFGDGITIANYTGTATLSSGNDQLQFSTVSASIHANEPVLIYGASNVNAAKILNIEIEEGTPTLTPGGASYSFVGSYSASTELAAGDYFIASDNKIYSVGATLPTMKGTRAYFHPVGGGVKAAGFTIDGNETGVLTLDGNNSQVLTGDIYTISGVRVSAPVKGLNIINGKKVFIK